MVAAMRRELISGSYISGRNSGPMCKHARPGKRTIKRISAIQSPGRKPVFDFRWP